MQILQISSLVWRFWSGVYVWESSLAVCVPSQPGLNFCLREPSCQLANQDRLSPFSPAWLWVAPRFSVTAPPLGLEVPTECLVCSMSQFSSVTEMIDEVVHRLLTVRGRERFQFGGTVCIPDHLPSDSLLSCMFCFVTTVTPALRSKGYFNIFNSLNFRCFS